MIIEKSVDDEVNVLNAFGIKINIAALIDDINSNFNQYQVIESETSMLLEINRNDGINLEVLKNMTLERMNQPILVTAIDGYDWVIDGNHRLLKRRQLGMSKTNYIPINGSQLDPYVSTFLG